MTSPIEAQAQRAERDRIERMFAKEAERQLSTDVREVFGTPAGRRLLHAFLTSSAFDNSALRFDVNGRGDALSTAHVNGWHDAARWWLALVRDYCPEREPQMRKEANEAARKAAQPESSDDHDHD